jgi:hypothetical protein
MSGKAFFTSSTIRKNLLLRPYPQMNGVTQANAPLGKVKTHEFQAVFERRFSKGFNLYFAYTRLDNRASDYFYNEWDAAPSWRPSNNGRPHRVAATGIWELPFGHKRAFFKQGPLGAVLGGFQIALRWSFSPGPCLISATCSTTASWKTSIRAIARSPNGSIPRASSATPPRLPPPSTAACFRPASTGCAGT